MIECSKFQPFPCAESSSLVCQSLEYSRVHVAGCFSSFDSGVGEIGLRSNDPRVRYSDCEPSLSVKFKILDSRPCRSVFPTGLNRFGKKSGSNDLDWPRMASIDPWESHELFLWGKVKTSPISFERTESIEKELVPWKDVFELSKLRRRSSLCGETFFRFKKINCSLAPIDYTLTRPNLSRPHLSRPNLASPNLTRHNSRSHF